MFLCSAWEVSAALLGRLEAAFAHLKIELAKMSEREKLPPLSAFAFWTPLTVMMIAAA